MISSVNPYTHEVISNFAVQSEQEVNIVISLAHEQYEVWRKTPLSDRSSLFEKVAKHLRDHKSEFAILISREMGKPVLQAIGEVEKCAWLCEYYAKEGAHFLKSVEIPTDAGKSYVTYDPLGVILGVMPWNYPFWQVFRFAVPTILSGNTVLLKHASNVMGCAEAIEKIFTGCGFPVGVFQHLVVGSDRVESILTHKKVRGVSLTGSEKAGRAVAAIAGRELKTSLLELGGSNAFIVMDDAHLDKAVDTALNARYQNTGQSCIAAKRLLLHRAIAHEFSELFTERLKKMKSGDPLNETTYIGVLAREDLASELESQMKRSLERGAQLIFGGGRKGAYFEPTVLQTDKTDIPAMQEETFGPLVCMYTFDTLEEAIKVSNSTNFGLGVTVFTADPERILSMTGEFREGAVFINEMVKSDPRLPFGGIKNSGYGRELGSEGIRAFVNTKTVYVNFQSR